MFGIDEAVAAGLKVLNKFIPDPAEKIKAEAELRSGLFELDRVQSEVNKAEAANPSLFVSGWRPAIGWTCAGALFYQYVFVPLGMWILTWTGLSPPQPPTLDDTLWQLMFGMLGMGGLRTFEKLKGVAK
jgi:Protein of unknown function (DUF3154).